MACFFFKKQLELAWEQNNLQAELSAYDNLSLEYFYLGELEKAHYYHDRIIRGKFESDVSVNKKTSSNLLRSRREVKHQKDLVR